MSRPLQRVHLWLTVPLAVIAFSVCGVLAYRTQQFVSEAAVADGVVARVHDSGVNPDVQFTTSDGQRIRYAQHGGVSGVEVGDRVRVLYSPDDPHDTACIDRIGALYADAGFAGFAGVLLAVLSVIAWDGPVHRERQGRTSSTR